MKSLCVALGLACVLAVTSAAAGERVVGVKPRMPLVPTVEEQRQELRKALRHPDPLKRLPFPVAGLKRKEAPVVFPANKAKPTFLHKKRDEKARALARAKREAQPDFAGRVEVKRDGDVKIVNGQKAVLGQFPWQAGVLMDLGWEGKAWCGGSIVHSLWILTAGHCVDDMADSYTISVGSLGSEQGNEPSRQVFTGVTEFYQHPAYNSYFIDNDIAFLKLPSHIEFSAYTRPVRLPSYSMATDMMVGQIGTVSGWGLTHDTDSWISSDLMYTQNTIDDGSACYNTYGNVWIANKICVQTPDAHSFCSGDSGGAFTFEEEPGVHTQIGIVSFGAAAGCELKYPGAYTRLASFLEFVEETTNIAIRD